ncbi:MAG: hypothetical protein QG597_2699 [Actinomycetota bacterium]|nr:hypothetical protein [Actinomycetota bacterium]
MDYDISIEDISHHHAAVVTATLAVADIGAFMGEAFGEVLAALAEQGLQPVGPPFGRYEPVADQMIVEAGFPCSGKVTASGRVEPTKLPGGPTATTVHHGPYDQVGQAYDAVVAWVAASPYQISGKPWESYLDGPEVAEPRTVVRFPCHLVE